MGPENILVSVLVGFLAARLGLRMARERAAPPGNRRLTTSGLVSAMALVMGVIYLCLLAVIALRDGSALTAGQVLFAVIFVLVGVLSLRRPSGDP